MSIVTIKKPSKYGKLFYDSRPDRQGFQVLFNIPVRDFTVGQIRSPVNHTFAGYRSKPEFRGFTLFLINKIFVLPGNRCHAVFDLIYLTGDGSRIFYDHIELTDCELEPEYILSGVCHFRFQENDILHHPSSDLIQYPVKDPRPVNRGYILKFFITDEPAVPAPLPAQTSFPAARPPCGTDAHFLPG